MEMVKVPIVTGDFVIAAHFVLLIEKEVKHGLI